MSLITLQLIQPSHTLHTLDPSCFAPHLMLHHVISLCPPLSSTLSCHTAHPLLHPVLSHCPPPCSTLSCALCPPTAPPFSIIYIPGWKSMFVLYCTVSWGQVTEQPVCPTSWLTEQLHSLSLSYLLYIKVEHSYQPAVLYRVQDTHGRGRLAPQPPASTACPQQLGGRVCECVGAKYR